MDSHSLIREGKRLLRSFCPQPILTWREAQYYWKYGEIELQLVECLCDPSRDSIDVGAHDGCYVHFMKRYSRRVIAFEPLPWLAELLARKFRRRVEVSNIALSSAAGTAALRIPIMDGTPVPGCSSISQDAAAQYPQYKEIQVQMDALDQLYAGEVGFIKIDVEGHEHAVLEGARSTIARCHPRLLIEIDERLSPGGVHRVSGFLGDLDYRGCFIFQGKLLPIEEFDASLMQRPEDVPDMTMSLDQRERFTHYVYNFLFYPADTANGLLEAMESRIAALA